MLALIRDRLASVAPELVEACVVEGTGMRGEPGWSIDLTPRHGPHADHHDDNAGHHYDIAFTPARDTHPDAAVLDCVTGVGSTAREAARRAIGLWMQGAGACVLELIDRRARFAEHFPGDDPHGVPGWYTLVSRSVAYGASADSSALLARWAVDHAIVRTLAEPILAGLDRPQLNGVKLYYCCGPSGSVAEVRINGRRDAVASASLASLDWPLLEGITALRLYALLACPDDPDLRGADGMPRLPGFSLRLGGEGETRALS
jgi:Family of unknown function (DUF6348)